MKGGQFTTWAVLILGSSERRSPELLEDPGLVAEMSTASGRGRRRCRGMCGNTNGGNSSEPEFSTIRRELSPGSGHTDVMVCQVAPYEQNHVWWRARAAALERDAHRCRRCGSRESLHVHHRTPIRGDRSEGCGHHLDGLGVLCRRVSITTPTTCCALPGLIQLELGLARVATP